MCKFPHKKWKTKRSTIMINMKCTRSINPYDETWISWNISPGYSEWQVCENNEWWPKQSLQVASQVQIILEPLT